MKLSIVTVNLNHAEGLRRTAESVIGQTFRDFEFIVIDGGSTDGSRAAIEVHADRIAYWVSEPDGGIYAAMNKGLRRAGGTYVYFLNSGDRLHAPDVLDRIFGTATPDEDLLYGDVVRPDKTGALSMRRHPDVLTVAAFWRFGVCQQAIFYKRELFGRLGGFDERLRIAGDWDFALRVLMARGTCRHLPFPVVSYEGGGISVVRKEEAAREKEAVLSRHLPEAVYRDYERLRVLERRCREQEEWLAAVRARNPLLNVALAAKWHWKKMTGRGGGRTP